VVAETEHALSAMKKVTCLVNVLKEAVAVIEVQSNASNVMKKAICRENVLKVEAVVAEIELALSVAKRVTCQESVHKAVEEVTEPTSVKKLMEEASETTTLLEMLAGELLQLVVTLMLGLTQEMLLPKTTLAGEGINLNNPQMTVELGVQLKPNLLTIQEDGESDRPSQHS
jgi:hypothetical protein